MSFFLPVFFMYNCVRVTRYRSFDISAERCEVDICSAHINTHMERSDVECVSAYMYSCQGD
jgi:hypothetical protein